MKSFAVLCRIIRLHHKWRIDRDVFTVWCSHTRYFVLIWFLFFIFVDNEIDVHFVEIMIMGLLFSCIARLIKDPKTQRPKGFGFVKFESEVDAEKALKAMNGRVLSLTLYYDPQLVQIETFPNWIMTKLILPNQQIFYILNKPKDNPPNERN